MWYANDVYDKICFHILFSFFLHCTLCYSPTAGHYVFLLGTYRSLYIVNWVYRAYTEFNYRHNILVYFAGLVQTLLYADFFYYYAIRYCCCVLIVIPCSFLLLFFSTSLSFLIPCIVSHPIVLDTEF